MNKYDYLGAVTADAKDQLLDNYEIEFIIKSEDYGIFYDKMFIEDSVTGNGSGSYTFSTWVAEEHLAHNLNLLVEAAETFGYKNIEFDWIENAETADVMIRCYLLDKAIQIAIEEIKNERTNK